MYIVAIKRMSPIIVRVKNIKADSLVFESTFMASYIVSAYSCAGLGFAFPFRTAGSSDGGTFLLAHALEH